MLLRWQHIEACAFHSVRFVCCRVSAQRYTYHSVRQKKSGSSSGVRVDFSLFVLYRARSCQVPPSAREMKARGKRAFASLDSGAADTLQATFRCCATLIIEGFSRYKGIRCLHSKHRVFDVDALLELASFVIFYERVNKNPSKHSCFPDLKSSMFYWELFARNARRTQVCTGSTSALNSHNLSSTVHHSSRVLSVALDRGYQYGDRGLSILLALRQHEIRDAKRAKSTPGENYLDRDIVRNTPLVWDSISHMW